MESTNVWQAGANSRILKADGNCWVGMVKNRCDQSGHGTLKLTLSKA